MPDQPTPAPVSIPLSRWAERMLRAFESVSDAKGLAGLSGATLLGERAALGNYVITGKISAGPGSSRLYRTRDGRWFALTISRNVDRDYLRALFADAALDPFDEDAIASAAARHDCDSLLARGRTLGLAVAAVDEQPVSPAVSRIATGPLRKRKAHAPALVVDLSTIWAGPLAGNLLWLAGAKVVKVESKTRPDALRAFDLPMFARLNQGKANVVVDLADNAQRSALLRLIRRADIVIESSRVRALMHFGIDADALVREVPGLVWITISAHGARGEAASWIGMGHDCGIAGGLAAALAEVTGEPGYVGDAIADPLTGILAALEGWRAWQGGKACRLGVALSGVVARALAEERAHDEALLRDELRKWGMAMNQPFPAVAMRQVTGELRNFGADTDAWLQC